MMNVPTIIVLTLLSIIFVLIVANEIRKHKNGKGSCGCGCNGCSMEGICHKKENK